MKINRFCISTAVMMIFLCYGCCFPGGEKQITDTGIILWQGRFPYDYLDERGDRVLVNVKHKTGDFGKIETRERCLRLVFVAPQGKEKTLWEYVDYGAVDKITLSPSDTILRIYFDCSFMGIRKKQYVTELDLHSMKKKTVLIKCGEWNF